MADVFNIFSQLVGSDCAGNIMEFVFVNDRAEHKVKMNESLNIINLWNNYDNNTGRETFEYKIAYAIVHAIDCALIASKLNDKEMLHALNKCKYMIGMKNTDRHIKYIRFKVRMYAYMYSRMILAHCVYNEAPGVYDSSAHYHRFPDSDIMDIVAYGKLDYYYSNIDDGRLYTCCRNIPKKLSESMPLCIRREFIYNSIEVQNTLSDVRSKALYKYAAIGAALGIAIGSLLNQTK